MNLKMYVINEGDFSTDWVVAENKEQAVGIYKDITGIDLNEEYESNNYNDMKDLIREMAMDEKMTYYDDGINPEKDTVKNLINKYCTSPDFFATSEF